MIVQHILFSKVDKYLEQQSGDTDIIQFGMGYILVFPLTYF